MNELLMLMEWVAENFEIIDLVYNRGCHCYDFTLHIEYCDFNMTVYGIAFLNGDLSNHVTVSNDFTDKETEINDFTVGMLDTIRDGFHELIDNDDFAN